MAKVLIQITEDDIRRGVPISADRCPMAHALRRATGYDWQVGVSCIWRNDSSGNVLAGSTTQLPKKAVQFVTAVDCHHPVHPLWFEMEIPDA